jgi:hypothetical protein
MENYKVPKKEQNPLVLNTVASAAVFGLLRFAGLSGLKVQDAENSPYTINQGDSQDYPLPKFVSKLNTIVYSNLIFNKDKQLDNNGNIVFEWQDFQIDDILISVSQSKKIITTEIQGRDGTVKEYIGMDDFQISLTGRISGSYNVYEKELVSTLKKILSSGQPLAVTSWYLQNLDIVNVVIKDFNFGQTEGEYSTQYFTISAISDNVVEGLIINQ